MIIIIAHTFSSEFFGLNPGVCGTTVDHGRQHCGCTVDHGRPSQNRPLKELQRTNLCGLSIDNWIIMFFFFSRESMILFAGNHWICVGTVRFFKGNHWNLGKPWDFSRGNHWIFLREALDFSSETNEMFKGRHGIFLGKPLGLFKRKQSVFQGKPFDFSRETDAVDCLSETKWLFKGNRGILEGDQLNLTKETIGFVLETIPIFQTKTMGIPKQNHVIFRGRPCDALGKPCDCFRESMGFFGGKPWDSSGETMGFSKETMGLF